jgi:hypothetical protein
MIERNQRVLKEEEIHTLNSIITSYGFKFIPKDQREFEPSPDYSIQYLRDANESKDGYLYYNLELGVDKYMDEDFKMINKIRINTIRGISEVGCGPSGYVSGSIETHLKEIEDLETIFKLLDIHKPE